jgi:predicted HAD superfamily Cof-like phosphohydrolase
MTKQQTQVLKFMRMFEQDMQVYPSIPCERTQTLRKALVTEEFAELLGAIDDQDLPAIADGCADLMYVILGLANAYGFDLEPVFEEVHRSNMTKVGGKINHLGKLTKPSTYSPAKIDKVLVAWVG